MEYRRTIERFMQGNEVTANVLGHLGMRIGRVDLSRMRNLELTKQTIARLVTAFAITEVIIDINEINDTQENILLGLLHSRWTKGIILRNVYEQIDIISPMVEFISIEAELSTKALGEILNNENLRFLTMTGGAIGQWEWLQISRRTRPLERVELNNTDVLSTTHFTEATQKIKSLTTRNLIAFGERLDEDDSMNY